MTDVPAWLGTLDASVLNAKLSIPETRADAVSRADLIEKARTSDCRVVGITAPAGYGKSTLLAQWAEAEDRRVAWVSLDRFDDDPASFVMLMGSAYARVSPENPELLADLSGLGTSVLGRAAPRLASAFRTSPSPFLFVLDDLHELQSPDCHDALEVVIAGVPQGSQLVAASRSEQPHLPRLRASGDTLELGVSHLALDSTGATQIFGAASIRLDQQTAIALTERTEGWPVGLYLAAMVAKERGNEALTISGDDRFVTDYLYRESVSRLPDADQRFLRWTAVLDHICAPLCDAILGESGSQQRLRRLETSNSFLVPLDRRREWYRYHGLFREFLLAELRRTEPDVVAKIHLRAADWYETNGSPDMAVEHLLNTGERDRCIQHVTALVLPTYQAGQMSTVQRWLAELGDDAFQEHPPLSVLAGWVAVMSGHTAEAARLVAIMDALSYDKVPDDGSASFDSARAMLRAAMCADGPEQMLVDASLALAQEPPWSIWRDLTLCECGLAYLLVGDTERAIPLLKESSTLAEAMSNADNLIIDEFELAVLAMDSGRWEEAAGHVERALVAVDAHRMHDYAVSPLAFAAAARLAVHHGDVSEANRQLTRAMRARPALTFLLPYLAVGVRIQLASVYCAIDDRRSARHLLREIDDILVHRPALGTLVDDVSKLRQMLNSEKGHGASGHTPLTPAELRLLPYLQTHLTIREIAERLYVSRNTVNTEVSAIYRKLGASSRGDAVQRATTIGLLGG